MKYSYLFLALLISGCAEHPLEPEKKSSSPKTPGPYDPVAFSYKTSSPLPSIQPTKTIAQKIADRLGNPKEDKKTEKPWGQKQHEEMCAKTPRPYTPPPYGNFGPSPQPSLPAPTLSPF